MVPIEVLVEESILLSPTFELRGKDLVVRKQFLHGLSVVFSDPTGFRRFQDYRVEELTSGLVASQAVLRRFKTNFTLAAIWVRIDLPQRDRWRSLCVCENGKHTRQKNCRETRRNHRAAAFTE